MVRVVSAPITLIDERLWPECRHCVFYLFKAFFYIYWLSLQWILAIGCFVLFLPPFSFGWHAFGWGLLCKRLFYYQAGFLWLEFMCCFCWVLPLYAFILCLFSFFVCLSGFSSELELLSITPFSHPDCFFSPCFFHYVTPLFLQCILGTRKWSQMPRMR